MIYKKACFFLYLPPCPGHYPSTGLRNVSQVEVPFVGDVGSLYKQVVMLGCPLQLQVQCGIGAVPYQLSVADVVTHSVLQTDTPCGGQAFPDFMIQSSNELVPQVLHGIVAFVDFRIIVPLLVDMRVTHCQVLDPCIMSGYLVEVETTLNFVRLSGRS